MTPEEIKSAIETINVMRASYAHIRHSNSEWEATETALDALRFVVELKQSGLPEGDLKGILSALVNNCFMILPVPDGSTLYELEAVWSDEEESEGHCYKGYECPHCAGLGCENFVNDHHIVRWKINTTRFSVIPIYYAEKLKKLGISVFIDKKEAEKEKAERERKLLTDSKPEDK